MNALGQAVRAGLLAAVEQAESDAAVKAVLIVGEGKAFIAGADIREFGKPAMPPSLPEVLNRLEASDKIVVAAIHGPALGGGLEVAMSAHYRLALPAAKLGLPEVNLGLLPGAGGTQRAPRLMGVKAAADLMLSGKHLSAKAALAAGLVDKLVDGTDATAAGLAYANELLATNTAPRRTRDIEIADKAAALAELDALAAETAKKSRGLFSPLKIVECVRAAVELPFDEGIAKERALFVECLNSPQRAGLIHAFFAERETAKIPEAKAAAPRRCQDRRHRRRHHGRRHHGVRAGRGPHGDHDRARRRVHRARPGQCGEGLQRPDRQGPHDRGGQGRRHGALHTQHLL